MRLRLLAPVLLLLLAPSFLAMAQPSSDSPARQAQARAAAAALAQLYDPATGLFSTTGWWNAANAVTALTDEARITGDRAHLDLLGNTFTHAAQKHPAFLNEFYDDEGWWALAWIDAYDLTHRKPYLHAAEAIFTDMTGGWNTTCGGGIWWKKDSHYKNAIANELFLSVAAALALRTHGKQHARDLDWASREWTWFAQSGMINPDHLVNDGLTIDPAGACHNNGRTTWTYNQGVLLGGLTDLSRATHAPDLLPTANRVATAALTHLTDAAGILHDPCEPDCGEDGVQFKGIFTRNLAHLHHAAPDPAFPRFLQLNADSAWQNARTPGDRFSAVWSGPPRADNAAAQTSALDLLNAAATVGQPTSPESTSPNPNNDLPVPIGAR